MSSSHPVSESKEYNLNDEMKAMAEYLPRRFNMYTEETEIKHELARLDNDARTEGGNKSDDLARNIAELKTQQATKIHKFDELSDRAYAALDRAKKLVADLKEPIQVYIDTLVKRKEKGMKLDHFQGYLLALKQAGKNLDALYLIVANSDMYFRHLAKEFKQPEGTSEAEHIAAFAEKTYNSFTKCIATVTTKYDKGHTGFLMSATDPLGDKKGDRAKLYRAIADVLDKDPGLKNLRSDIEKSRSHTVVKPEEAAPHSPKHK